MLTTSRELFGVSETDGDEDGFDHSEDSENGNSCLYIFRNEDILLIYIAEEIENLRREAQALKAIRESIGSEGFAQRVFDKVFKDDIERLRGMEDMWKTRKPPIALDYEPLQEKTTSIEAGVSQDDQRVWTVEENFSVFKDR
jgi:ubiquitin-like 1-activating enzyme E1 B